LSYREAGGSVYFRIQLEAFLYPRDLAAFGQHLRQALAPSGLPQLTAGNPENTNDGVYAISADSIFGQVNEYLWSDEAWAAAVENLSDARALGTNAEQSPVFMKVDVFPRSASPKRLPPVIRDDASIYVLKRGKPYELSVTYRFPRQRVDQAARGRAEINLGDNLRLVGNTSIGIDSYTNSVLIPFISARETEDASGSITLSALDDSNQPKLLMPDSSLLYNIGESTAFWLQIIVAGLLFSIAGAFIGLDFSKIAPLSVQLKCRLAKVDSWSDSGFGSLLGFPTGRKESFLRQATGRAPTHATQLCAHGPNPTTCWLVLRCSLYRSRPPEETFGLDFTGHARAREGYPLGSVIDGTPDSAGWYAMAFDTPKCHSSFQPSPIEYDQPRAALYAP
jgi:hypothetical protein